MNKQVQHIWPLSHPTSTPHLHRLLPPQKAQAISLRQFSHCVTGSLLFSPGEEREQSFQISRGCFVLAAMETFVKFNEAIFYTSNLIAAAERWNVTHEQGWLTGRSCIQSKRAMINAGRRELFVQFQIMNPCYRRWSRAGWQTEWAWGSLQTESKMEYMGKKTANDTLKAPLSSLWCAGEDIRVIWRALGWR